MNEIKDTEIRIIGGNNNKNNNKFPWKWVLLGLFLAAVIIISIFCFRKNNDEPTAEPDEIGVFDSVDTLTQSHPLQAWFSSLDTITATGTVIKDTTVNDIPLRIYVPLNATPHLEVGYDLLKNPEKNILFFQAADVRADNGKIVGAFVLQGKPLSWGLSKKGYCSIIDNNITVGVADNSPLFEEATEKDGYFFRQYALVDSCRLVENNIKAKTLRRGLCEIEGKTAVIETQTPESMHDFSEALIDLGSTNAIYIVGSASIGWCSDINGNNTEIGIWTAKKYKNASFIVWAI